MNEQRRREIIDRIVPEVALRTSATPTVRDGRQILVTAVTSNPDRSEKGEQPDLWIAEDRIGGGLAGLGDPALWSVVPADWSAIGERHRDAVPPASFDHPRDAFQIMKRLWMPAVEAFFDGNDVGVEERLQVDRAARHLTPPALAPWIFAACDDFWTWLRHDRDGARETPPTARR